MIGTTSFAKMEFEDFRWMQEWIYAYSAIIIEDGRKFVVEKKLHPILVKHKLPSFSAFFKMISSGYAAELHADTIEALTANETWFYRDPVHFELLKQRVLPDLIERHKHDRTLHIWSAGCSTGQEAYSLAMLLAETPALDGWKIWLLGTDLSYRQIQRAREGRYGREEASRGLPSAQLMRHFKQDGLQWQAKAELRASVEFQVLRLEQAWRPLPSFDLVLMRNVLFHFNEAHRLDLLWRVRKQMAHDGILMLGALEKNELADSFEAEGNERFPFYRKTGRVAARTKLSANAPQERGILQISL